MKIVLSNEFVGHDEDCERCGGLICMEDSCYMIESDDGEDLDGPYCCETCAKRDLTECILNDEELTEKEQQRLIDRI